MGSFFSRALLMVFGYAYPAYKCFKIIEKDQPQVEHLLFWSHYWILVAFATVFEKVGDPFISWLPLYEEAKLVIFVYLWHDKTKGAEYIYNYLCKDILSKHEDAIDRKLLKLRNKAWDLTLMSWESATSYGLMRSFETFQYAASRSMSLHRSVDTNEENLSRNRGEQEADAGSKNRAESPESSAIASGGDDKGLVSGQHVPEDLHRGSSKARNTNIRLQEEHMPDTGELKGSLASIDDVKTGMFRAAMDRLRNRK